MQVFTLGVAWGFPWWDPPVVVKAITRAAAIAPYNTHTTRRNGRREEHQGGAQGAAGPKDAEEIGRSTAPRDQPP